MNTHSDPQVSHSTDGKTDEWYDSMYNNRALVPDFADHFTRWQTLSEAARSHHRCVLDVAYGRDNKESLDIFPSEVPHSPVIVFVHGGYWRSLDKADHSFVAPELTKMGSCVVVPNYDLCPNVTIPQITMQMVKCLAWVHKNIKHWGGDPRQIHLIGHSAGGHLAAMLMACHWQQFDSDLPADLVKSALSISGLFDLLPLTKTPFLRDSLRLTPEDALRCSPALMPAPAHGKLLSVAGAAESQEFIRQNHLIQDSWGEHRVPVCEDLADLNHFSVMSALVTPHHRLHDLAQSLLD
jgi:arylformamidase